MCFCVVSACGVWCVFGCVCFYVRGVFVLCSEVCICVCDVCGVCVLCLCVCLCVVCVC